MIRTYTELMRFRTFESRFEYLRLEGVVGVSTFGYDRLLNQVLYRSRRWKDIRDEAIVRDFGCDLAIEGREIYDKIFVHHMNPITAEDIEMERDFIFDLEFLVCTSFNTHQAIHFSDESLLQLGPITRKRNDTCPWLK